MNERSNEDDVYEQSQMMVNENIEEDLDKRIQDSIESEQQKELDFSKLQLQTLDQLNLKSLAGISCLDYLNQQQSNIKHTFVPSGIKEIDNLLRNGIRAGIITEVYGADTSCKTSLALQFAFNAILSDESDQKGYTIYLSTTKKPHQQRMNQIIEGIKQRNGSLTQEKIMNSMDQFIEVSINTILKFQEFMQTEIHSLYTQFKKIRLIVIDNIYDIASQIEDFKEKHSFLFTAINLLKKIAHTNNTAILILNNVVAQINDNPSISPVFQGSSNNVIPALGNYWTHLINERLQLSILSECLLNTQLKLRQLTVKISPRLPPNSIKLIPDNLGLSCINQ